MELRYSDVSKAIYFNSTAECVPFSPHKEKRKKEKGKTKKKKGGPGWTTKDTQ